jgi:uncharacterized protein YndB with AHSA1/START domain
MSLITVQTTITASVSTVWECWINPEHVTKWNFASDDWHCPKATSELEVNGEFHHIMAAKDGSSEFDFWGKFTQIEIEKQIQIELGDSRKVTILFETKSDQTTLVTEHFEPENQNPLDLQKAGWQAILDNFKQYVETIV